MAGDFVSTPLHPPLAVVVSNQAEKDVLMDVWDWQAASVLSEAQLNVIAGVLNTVNLLVHVVVRGAQVLVYVQVTSIYPPLAEGATGLAGNLERTPLQPPLAVVD